MRNFTLALMLGLMTTTADADGLDGARWEFTMSPKSRENKFPPMGGQFRVKDNTLYQKTRPDSPTFDKPIGKNAPDGKRTKITFDDLRAFTPDKTVIPNIRGTALLEMERFGEWSGTLIDGRKRHWNFRCTRVEN